MKDKRTNSELTAYVVDKNEFILYNDGRGNQLGIEKQLCEVSLDVLIGLAVFLKLEEPKYQGKSRLGVARTVRRDIEEQVAQFEDENECLSFVTEIKELILQKAEEETPPMGNVTQDKEPKVLQPVV